MTSWRRTNTACRPGLTLIEATISMVVLSLVMISVMQGVGLSARIQHRTADELRGTALAKALADRIASYPYAEPIGASPIPLIGVESGEIAGDPGTYDDIDDWHGYSETPPTFPDGTPMSFLSGWTRAVEVRWVVSAAPSTDSGVDDGAKVIVVTVTRADGAEVARVTRLVFNTTNLRGS